MFAKGEITEILEKEEVEEFEFLILFLFVLGLNYRII